jgi:hypothetical protein
MMHNGHISIRQNWRTENLTPPEFDPRTAQPGDHKHIQKFGSEILLKKILESLGAGGMIIK